MSRWTPTLTAAGNSSAGNNSEGMAVLAIDQQQTWNYTGFKKLAVWFGNEGIGISSQALEHSVLCVNIPMFGIIESLNLGSASGIVLYEITKQRRTFQDRLNARITANKLRKRKRAS